jgi:hypothetical protein
MRQGMEEEDVEVELGGEEEKSEGGEWGEQPIDDCCMKCAKWE